MTWALCLPLAAYAASEQPLPQPSPDAEIADVTSIAYLGPAGTYTEEAAKLFFGDNDELLPQDTVADALAMVADGTAAYAVIPQENALGGPVTDYIDAKDSAAIAALAVEKGFELTAADFPFPDVDLFAGKEIDEKELEAVSGGSVVVTGPEWVADCDWYMAVACGLAAGSFLYI